MRSMAKSTWIGLKCSEGRGAMGDRWPPLPEFLGLAVGSLIVVSLAIGLFFLAQILGATGLPLEREHRSFPWRIGRSVCAGSHSRSVILSH